MIGVLSSLALGLLSWLLIFLSSICISLNAHEPTNLILDFESVYPQIVNNALEVEAAKANNSARVAERWQSQTLPNPELSVDLDTLSRQFNCDNNEVNIIVSQLVELGGKRGARMRVADANQMSSCWDVEIVKREILGEVLHAFIEIAATQKMMALALSQHEIATSNAQCTASKNNAGKTSILESKKAEIACNIAKINLSRRQVALGQAKRKLLALWKDGPSNFEGVTFPLEKVSPLPPYETLLTALKANPTLAKGQAELWKYWEIVELERAHAKPDVVLQAGISTENFYQEPSLNVGIDIPLPFFDQNRGNIFRAIHDYNEAYYTHEKLIIEMESSLAMLYEGWQASYEQAIAIRDFILPPAFDTYQLTHISYQEGKLDYQDLLEARGILFDFQSQLFEAVQEYHYKRADVLVLTGDINEQQN